MQGGDATQLKIEPGDYIQLLIPQPRDGWHYGENDRTGLKGWFPIKYTIKVQCVLMTIITFDNSV